MSKRPLSIEIGQVRSKNYPHIFRLRGKHRDMDRNMDYLLIKPRMRYKFVEAILCNDKKVLKIILKNVKNGNTYRLELEGVRSFAVLPKFCGLTIADGMIVDVYGEPKTVDSILIYENGEVFIVIRGKLEVNGG